MLKLVKQQIWRIFFKMESGGDDADADGGGSHGQNMYWNIPWTNHYQLSKCV